VVRWREQWFAQPAFAAITDISNVPLGSTAGATYLPTCCCHPRRPGSNGERLQPLRQRQQRLHDYQRRQYHCTRGDPRTRRRRERLQRFGYDPNFTYQNGLLTGQPVLNTPSGTLTPDVPDGPMPTSRRER